MYPFGYCTNVHAATSIACIESALTLHAVPIKAAVSPQDTMPIGLWLNEVFLQNSTPKPQFRSFRRG